MVARRLERSSVLTGVDGLTILASVLAHAALALMLSAAPRFSPGGESGFEGAGGPTVEVGIEGPLAPPSDPTPPSDPSEEQETSVESAAPRPTPAEAASRMVERPPPPADPAPLSQSPAEPARDSSTDADEARRAVLAPAPGLGDESSGRAPGEVSGVIAATTGQGTLGETRDALLGAGSFCEDPVAGTWVAQKYKREAGRGRWVRFTLEVARNGDRLFGRILSRIWDGDPSDRAPPDCRAFHSDMTWAMQARGLLVGDAMTFGSSHARIVRTDCPGHGAYAPDNFSGRVNPEAERFDARNNDGAYDIDEPYVFRRVACD